MVKILVSVVEENMGVEIGVASYVSARLCISVP